MLAITELHNSHVADNFAAASGDFQIMSARFRRQNRPRAKNSRNAALLHTESHHLIKAYCGGYMDIA